ncbi:glycosyltransferase family 4 protein [Patulibacter sp.]|uniref:glycosyltransferase family 4 protein n=1 Tax=Patulibacter sp. TaxID=1912859 RepID=UPI00271B58DA|nr:glycosyltransferase family 4 protein [Patulibacter sp.]MDO9408620.1 glycosyltransferase family 4 protein [Patulibacter sp.]
MSDRAPTTGREVLRPTLLNPVFWPEVRRGSERAVRSLADGLVAAGHAPRLVTSYDGRTPRYDVEDGLGVTRLPRVASRHLWRTVADDHAAHHPLALPLLSADPGDVLHAFYPTDATLAVRAAVGHRALGVVRPPGRGRRPRVPVVVSVMGPPDRVWGVAVRGRLEGLVDAARAADAVTTLSRFAQDRLWRTFAVRSEIVPPPVDLEAFAPDAATERHEAPTILFASDPASGAKRIGLLLDAVRIVRRDRPGVRLLVNRPTDAGLAADLTAVAGVGLVDLDDRGALTDAYRRAWVTALPSENEAFGLVVAESLACGTPGVAFAGEGPAEVLTGDDVGRIAPDATAASLAAALTGALELAEDPATPGRCRAAVGHLGVPEHTARTLRLYHAALARSA